MTESTSATPTLPVPASAPPTPSKLSKVAPFADKYLGRFVSKKLAVFIIACLFLYLGKLDGEQWMLVSSIYLGGQATVDAVLHWRAGGKRM